MDVLTPSPAAPHEAGCPAPWTAPVPAAARAALRPPGPVRWILEPLLDRVELRTVVRRWATAAEPSARTARISSGCALRAARLAVAVQDRTPVVSHPDRPGLLAVLHAGSPAAPRSLDLLLHAVMVQGGRPSWIGADVPGRPAALHRLRLAAESEGAWLRVLPTVAAGPALGRCWCDPSAATGDALTALVGAPGAPPAADLRLGQAVETVRLMGSAFGLDTQVLAAPATAAVEEVRRHAGPGPSALAVLRIGWPPC